jgi:tetratricopeptide (TPR) repeat protein
MVNRTLGVMMALALLAGVYSCKKVSSRQDLDNIHTLEKKAETNRLQVGKGGIQLDQQLLKDLGSAYIKFAGQYPDAPETPEFLFRAGELYSNELSDYPKAIEAFLRNYEKYPEHETAGNALFFVAYLYNNSVHDLIKAEKYYKEFLDRYPNHKMAASAKFELEMLGMPVDAVFEKLMGSDSSAQDSGSH